MHAEANSEMRTIYKSPGKRESNKTAMSLRVDNSVRAMMNDCVKLWKMLAEARSEDVGKIDLTYVCEGLLESGAHLAFEEFGLDLIENTNEEGEERKLRPAFDSGERDAKGKPISTVVTPEEWKRIEKIVRSEGSK